MAMVRSSSSRVDKIDADINARAKAPDPETVTTFNFEMEIDQELAFRKSKIRPRHRTAKKWHIKLNHLPFSKIKMMAHMGMIPTCLCKDNNNCDLRPSCIYGKAS